MPSKQGKARYEAVKEIGPGKDKDSYMVGRREDKPGSYGYEEGPKIKGEKEAREYASEMQRETKGYKKGGMVTVRGQGKVTKSKSCKMY
jgi:hypothetical protein